jgi:hypothetical protein
VCPYHSPSLFGVFFVAASISRPFEEEGRALTHYFHFLDIFLTIDRLNNGIFQPQRRWSSTFG